MEILFCGVQRDEGRGEGEGGEGKTRHSPLLSSFFPLLALLFPSSPFFLLLLSHLILPSTSYPSRSRSRLLHLHHHLLLLPSRSLLLPSPCLSSSFILPVPSLNLLPPSHTLSLHLHLLLPHPTPSPSPPVPLLLLLLFSTFHLNVTTADNTSPRNKRF